MDETIRTLTTALEQARGNPSLQQALREALSVAARSLTPSRAGAAPPAAAPAAVTAAALRAAAVPLPSNNPYALLRPAAALAPAVEQPIPPAVTGTEAAAYGPPLGGRSLRADWAAQENPHWTTESDRFYYYHIRTGETSWDPPFADGGAPLPPRQPLQQRAATSPAASVRVNRSGSVFIDPNVFGGAQLAVVPPMPAADYNDAAMYEQYAPASTELVGYEPQPPQPPQPPAPLPSGSPARYAGTNYEGLEWDGASGTWCIQSEQSPRYANASQLALSKRSGLLTPGGKTRKTWADKYAPPREPVSIFEKLTNPALFTSTHKHRFKKRAGRWVGRGKNGRDSLPKGRERATNPYAAIVRRP